MKPRNGCFLLRLLSSLSEADSAALGPYPRHRSAYAVAPALAHPGVSENQALRASAAQTITAFSLSKTQVTPCRSG